MRLRPQLWLAVFSNDNSRATRKPRSPQPAINTRFTFAVADGVSEVQQRADTECFLFVGFDVTPQAAEEINLPYKAIGKVLMLSATPVNNRFADLRNQLALAYEGDSEILSKKLKTGKSVEEIDRDTERDNFLSAQQALEYGLVDAILTNRETK